MTTSTAFCLKLNTPRRYEEYIIDSFDIQARLIILDGKYWATVPVQLIFGGLHVDRIDFVLGLCSDFLKLRLIS